MRTAGTKKIRRPAIVRNRDNGSMPAAIVYCLAVGFTIAAITSMVITAGKSSQASSETYLENMTQSEAIDLRHSKSLKAVDTLPQGNSAFQDKGRTSTYTVGSSNNFLGVDSAGQPKWGSTLSADPFEFVQLATSGSLQCGLTKAVSSTVGGDVYCWGVGTEGVGGNGANTFSSNTPLKTAASSHKGFSKLISHPSGACGVETGTKHLWCWGKSPVNAGVGPNIVNVPAKISPTAVKDVPASFAATLDTFCMVTFESKLACSGVLDNDDSAGADMKIMKVAGADLLVQSVHAGSKTILALGADGNLYGMSSGAGSASGLAGSFTTTIKTPTKVALQTGTIKDISVSAWDGEDAAYVNVADKLYSFGKIRDGITLGLRNQELPFASAPSLSVTQTYKSKDATCTLALDNKTYCWGSIAGATAGTWLLNSPTPVALNAATPKLKSFITSTSQTICAVTQTDTLWCWGTNLNGQLGRTTGAEGSLTPAAVGSGLFTNVSHPTSTDTTNCALTPELHAWCWGQNAQGQVGAGTDSATKLLPTKLAAKTPTGVTTTMQRRG